MKTPVVSIITPTYNHEKFIGQCIESVLTQTFANWEQIIIDDGSTDLTARVIRRYKDRRIKYIRQQHRGLPSLHEIYNDALALARGDFIAILEGDDFWPKDKLEKQLQTFDSPDIVLVWGVGVVTDEAGRPLFRRASIKTRDQLKDFTSSEILRMIRRDNPITPTSTVIVRRNELVRIGGFQPSPSRIYVDLPTWLKLAASNHYKFRFVNTVLGFWRTHSHQVSAATRSQQLFDHAKLISDYGLENYDLYSKYLQARGALSAQNWREAAHLFRNLLFSSSIDTVDRGICLLGFFSSMLHLDLVALTLKLKSYCHKWR